MNELTAFLTPDEAAAERAYLESYREEYLRAYDPARAGDSEHLLYWSHLAHQAGRRARERAPRVEPSVPAPATPKAGMTARAGASARTEAHDPESWKQRIRGETSPPATG